MRNVLIAEPIGLECLRFRVIKQLLLPFLEYVSFLHCLRLDLHKVLVSRKCKYGKIARLQYSGVFVVGYVVNLLHRVALGGHAR